jgi:DNA polymerase-3 subunit alpha (Gram-positive type)
VSDGVIVFVWFAVVVIIILTPALILMSHSKEKDKDVGKLTKEKEKKQTLVDSNFKKSIPQTYVVIDFETTGLNPQRDVIIEIAAVKVKNHKIVDTFSQLVKPKKQIPDMIVNLTGITNDMVANAPSINRVLPKFMNFIGKDVLVGHNIDFDSKFLSAACQRAQITYTNRVSDTLELSRRTLPWANNHKLTTVCRELGITNKNAHRALSDVKATQQVFEILGAKEGVKIYSHPKFTLKPNS